MSSEEHWFNRLYLFIDGRWMPAKSGDIRVSREAATELAIGQAAIGGIADIDAAVTSARAAFDEGSWASSRAQERAAVMRRMADQLRRTAATAVELVSRQNGMPRHVSSVFNGEAPAGLLDMYADMIETHPTEFEGGNANSIIRYEPVGVVAAITPWNLPLSLAMMKIAPALAAGCTIVLKPSPETALDSYLFADAAIAAGLPPGVLNIVVGDRDAGAHLVSHPGIDKVAFTGSTDAGRAIAAECGRLIRRVTLELGGKSAAIILDDADLDHFIGNLGNTTFMNNGQVCTSQARILAPRSRYDEIVDAVAGYVRSMTVGNPLDPEVTCGPMVSRHHQQKVLGYIEHGKSSRARLVAGGSAHDGPGWFVTPTLFADVDNSDVIAREEIFGPVAAIIPYTSESEAIAIANDSNYGLGGSVWTADEAHGLDVAHQIRTGTVGINHYAYDLGAPFGGMKDSGIGRELGVQGLHNYFEVKTIYRRPADAN
ncbi:MULTISPECIES: aldehyde dehydrogenase [unclassified Mycobacterium]|uniref:aldehyde dehydrogenase n=1 Tax=unclassified Mycobacterium TaxID=2642494 RepID=UPI0004915A19|nr:MULTISPECIES: aldehyde dehydrogenase [unclassified Mycobacterium]SEA31089.1 betaine-aldehyde dehydrogenase [Mycobacterium sp. 283mftsu]